jgi:hypothetical protein
MHRYARTELAKNRESFMFNDAEKEELRRTVNKFVERRRCFRPIHPDEVLKEVNQFKGSESVPEEESSEAPPRFQL